MTAVVDNFGWRTGYVTMAGVVLLVIVPIAFIMRRQPEDVGLLPDGISRGSGAGAERARAAVASDDRQTHTRSQAIRTPGFWLLTLGYGLNAVALGSVSFYAIPFASSIGFTRLIGATGMTINGFGNLTAKAIWGYGLQRIDPRRLAGAAFCTSATGVLLMVLSSNVESVLVLWVGFFLYGLGFGGTIPISEFLWAQVLRAAAHRSDTRHWPADVPRLQPGRPRSNRAGVRLHRHLRGGVPRAGVHLHSGGNRHQRLQAARSA